MYDPRLGRFLSVDPMINTQPGWSPYKGFLNNPITFTDKEGKTEYQVNIYVDEKSGKAIMDVKTANSVMTDGLTHSASSWYDATDHNVNVYYDYVTVTVTTFKANGDVVVKKAQMILYENGVKDTDIAWFGADPKETKRESWLTGPDYGKEVAFGIDFGSGSDGPVAKDWSKKAIGGGMKFSELESIFKSTRAMKDKTYSFGSGSWKSFDPKKVNSWIEGVKSKLEGGAKAGEALDKMFGKDMYCKDCQKTYDPLTHEKVKDDKKTEKDTISASDHTDY